MLPSSTVENYLKTIYLGGAALPHTQRLLPMGHLASSLGIAPGTATTMVKALAEAGLVEYEPYAGVALTPAGERLAGLVVRRHRLVELFLVQVMGFRWDEVHEEAEQLEHAVSDRLIDRMDEMLGRPDVDPHGDPIPNAQGVFKAQEAQNLLTCPLHTPVTVTRVIDQDKMFLRFIEKHHLKPGESIEVEDRDSASDSVCVRGKDDQRITIGTGAASKLLVQIARVVLLTLAFAQAVMAQDRGAVRRDSNRPFEILDNSFLVEEAFNQEAGVFQNIFTLHVVGREEWETGFTQEWPLFSKTHQLSFTIPYEADAGVSGIGDVMLNYRLQVLNESGSMPAFSPRLSLILPSGDSSRGFGAGSPGWQLNLPFSRQLGDLYVHWNAGVTQFPSAKGDGAEWNLVTPHIAASGIWRARPMFNVMFESVVEWEEAIEGGATRRDTSVTFSPGFRTGWNNRDAQTVVGFGIPIVMSGGATNVGAIGYFSYELPFSRP